MAVKENLIMSADIQVTARELDFVTRFEQNCEHLREILGIMRPIKKVPGAILKSKYAEGTLESGQVGEGEDIPYSKFTVKEKTYDGPEYTAYLITGRVYYKLQIEYIIYCPSNIIASKDQLKK